MYKSNLTKYKFVDKKLQIFVSLQQEVENIRKYCAWETSDPIILDVVVPTTLGTKLLIENIRTCEKDGKAKRCLLLYRGIFISTKLRAARVRVKGE